LRQKTSGANATRPPPLATPCGVLTPFAILPPRHHRHATPADKRNGKRNAERGNLLFCKQVNNFAKCGYFAFNFNNYAIF
jgi:hypothetical protein